MAAEESAIRAPPGHILRTGCLFVGIGWFCIDGRWAGPKGTCRARLSAERQGRPAGAFPSMSAAQAMSSTDAGDPVLAPVTCAGIASS